MKKLSLIILVLLLGCTKEESYVTERMVRYRIEADPPGFNYSYAYKNKVFNFHSHNKIWVDECKMLTGEEVFISAKLWSDTGSISIKVWVDERLMTTEYGETPCPALNLDCLNLTYYLLL